MYFPCRSRFTRSDTCWPFGYQSAYLRCLCHGTRVCANKTFGTVWVVPSSKQIRLSFFFIEWKFVYQVHFFSWKNGDEKKKKKRVFFSRPRKFFRLGAPRICNPCGRSPSDRTDWTSIFKNVSTTPSPLYETPTVTVYPSVTHEPTTIKNKKTPLSLRKDPPRTIVLNLRFFFVIRNLLQKADSINHRSGTRRTNQVIPRDSPDRVYETPTDACAPRHTWTLCIRRVFVVRTRVPRKKRRQFNISRKNDVRNVRNLKKHRYRQRKIRHVPP